MKGTVRPRSFTPAMSKEDQMITLQSTTPRMVEVSGEYLSNLIPS